MGSLSTDPQLHTGYAGTPVRLYLMSNSSPLKCERSSSVALAADIQTP